MGKRLLVFVMVLVFAASLTLAGDKEKKDGSWVGWVTDTHCGAKGANAKHADCAKKCVETHDAKYALYTPADKKVYVLEPQDKAAGHAGHHVKVTGTVDGEKIQVKSIEMTGEQKGETK
jgi:hypothetical protein